MAETTKTRELKQLQIDDQGKITLEGKVVDAKPIGKPFPTMLQFLTQGQEEGIRRLHRVILEQEFFRFPKEANAYVPSGGIVGYAGINEAMYAIQPYKIEE